MRFPLRTNILYTVGNNKALNTFVEDFYQSMDKKGIKNPPKIVRLYSAEREVERYLRRDNKTSRFDKSAAEAVAEGEFSEVDRYLAGAALNMQAGKRENFEEKFPSHFDKKSPTHGIALNDAAHEYFLENLDRHTALNELMLKRVNRGEELSDDERKAEKEAVKSLYRDFLNNFTGIVCSTPAAATSPMVRDNFHPDMVMVDEAGRTKELELCPLIAFYEGPWILVGDPRQLGPHVRHNCGNAERSRNAFVNQEELSIIGRG